MGDAGAGQNYAPLACTRRTKRRARVSSSSQSKLRRMSRAGARWAQSRPGPIILDTPAAYLQGFGFPHPPTPKLRGASSSVVAGIESPLRLYPSPEMQTVERKYCSYPPRTNAGCLERAPTSTSPLRAGRDLGRYDINVTLVGRAPTSPSPQAITVSTAVAITDRLPATEREAEPADPYRTPPRRRTGRSIAWRNSN